MPKQRNSHFNYNINHVGNLNFIGIVCSCRQFACSFVLFFPKKSWAVLLSIVEQVETSKKKLGSIIIFPLKMEILLVFEDNVNVAVDLLCFHC